MPRTILQLHVGPPAASQVTLCGICNSCTPCFGTQTWWRPPRRTWTACSSLWQRRRASKCAAVLVAGGQSHAGASASSLTVSTPPARAAAQPRAGLCARVLAPLRDLASSRLHLWARCVALMQPLQRLGWPSQLVVAYSASDCVLPGARTYQLVTEYAMLCLNNYATLDLEWSQVIPYAGQPALVYSNHSCFACVCPPLITHTCHGHRCSRCQPHLANRGQHAPNVPVLARGVHKQARSLVWSSHAACTDYCAAGQGVPRCAGTCR